jgi:hypothetical protein
LAQIMVALAAVLHQPRRSSVVSRAPTSTTLLDTMDSNHLLFQQYGAGHHGHADQPELGIELTNILPATTPRLLHLPGSPSCLTPRRPAPSSTPALILQCSTT